MSTSGRTDTSTFQVLTSRGPAAIAVIRVRGPLVEQLMERRLRARRPLSPRAWPRGAVRRAALADADGGVLDDVLVSVHSRPPAWDLRLHLHGSPGLIGRCTEMLTELGFVACAEPATTLWDAADTIAAEGHALLPRMQTEAGARWLVRQIGLLPETLARLAAGAAGEAARAECRTIAARAAMFDWFARPARIALVGPSNVGKSTLVNALADQPVSLVAPTPGTTRDWVQTPGEACGYPVIWLDTAGLRSAGDALEAAGVARTRGLMEQSDAVLVVLDVTDVATAAQFLAECAQLQPVCVALNKCDLADAGAVRRCLAPEWRARSVAVSATERLGLADLVAGVVAGLGRAVGAGQLEAPAAFTRRQVHRLEAASVERGRERFREHLRRCLHEPPGR